MCTVIGINDVKGNLYKARTFEHSSLFPSALTYLPPGTHVVSMTPDGKDGMTFDTKFGILGMILPAIVGSRQESFVDAMNDQGLSISLPAQNFTKSPPIVTNDPTKILSAADIVHWLLGSCKDVNEVKAALNSDVEFWLPPLPLFENENFPVHFAIMDRFGGSIVLEFMNGKKSVYDNPVNVLTNGPEFPWHLINLANYTQSNIDQNSSQFGSLKVSQAASGIAASAIPSSQTPIGRFVKAAFYNTYVQKAETPDDAVVTLGHIINNFDRPRNLTIDFPVAGQVGDGGGGNGPSCEVTDFTIMNDLSRNLYYTRNIYTLNWTVVDLNKLNGVKQSKNVNAYEIHKLGADATSFFIN